MASLALSSWPSGACPFRDFTVGMGEVFYLAAGTLEKTTALEYKRGTMGRRRHQRFRKQMMVQIYGLDAMGQPFSQTASVLDVSEQGVRLEGAQVLDRAGATVTLEHGGNKGQYRVVWVGVGQLAGQAGLMNLDPNKSVFGLSFPPSTPDKYVVPAQPAFDEGLRKLVEEQRKAEKRHEERRKYKRYPVRGDAEIYAPGAESPERCTFTDFSRGGCFLESLSAIALDTQLTLVLLISQRKIRVQGQVRSILPNFGLGIQFVHVEPADLQQLEEMLAALEQGAPLGPMPPPAPLPATPPPAATPVDSRHALEAVKSWFGEHDALTRQEFLALLKRVGAGSQ